MVVLAQSGKEGVRNVRREGIQPNPGQVVDSFAQLAFLHETIQTEEAEENPLDSMAVGLAQIAQPVQQALDPELPLLLLRHRQEHLRQLIQGNHHSLVAGFDLLENALKNLAKSASLQIRPIIELDFQAQFPFVNGQHLAKPAKSVGHSGKEGRLATDLLQTFDQLLSKGEFVVTAFNVDEGRNVFPLAEGLANAQDERGFADPPRGGQKEVRLLLNLPKKPVYFLAPIEKIFILYWGVSDVSHYSLQEQDADLLIQNCIDTILHCHYIDKKW